VFSNQHRKAKLLFGLSDILLSALAFVAAYQTRSALSLGHTFYFSGERKALVLGLCILTSVLTGYWLQVYGRLGTSERRVVLGDSLRQSGYAAVGLIFLEFALRLDLSRPFLFLYVGYSWLLLLTFRLGARRLVGFIRREFGSLRYVMVVGVSERALRLGRALEAAADQGVRLRGFLSDDVSAPLEVQLVAAYPVRPLADLPALLRREVIDEVIFAVESEALSSLEPVFLRCDEEGVRTRVAVDFFPHVNSEMHLDRLGVTPLLTFSAAPDDEIRLLMKRGIDILIAAAALLVALPFLLLIALAIRLNSPGPAIFHQERCGLNGRRFTFYKFRSMCQDAEARKAQYMHLSQRDLATKIPDDPRLTSLGRYLRRFSIDEMPQLFNILKGDMSLVGPRPAIPSEVAQYQVWQRRRLRMRPGLTCLWALNGRDQVDFETWMKMDMQYIDNWSLSLDWKILFQTIPQVVLGKGAH
jgi:exopolysaccharide biosynthesis polyprenyl glycosylphosphotransferase